MRKKPRPVRAKILQESRVTRVDTNPDVAMIHFRTDFDEYHFACTIEELHKIGTQLVFCAEELQIERKNKAN